MPAVCIYTALRAFLGRQEYLFLKNKKQTPSSTLVRPCRLASVAADVLTPIVLPVDHHDAPTPSRRVPRAPAPAAVPEPALGLEGAGGQRARGLRVARGRGVADPFGRGLPTCSAVRLGAFAAVAGGGADVLAYELVGDLMAHFEWWWWRVCERARVQA